MRMRLWGGLVVVVVVLAACRGGGGDSFTTAGGSGSGPVIGSGSSGATGTTDGPVPVDAGMFEMPFVACSLPDGGADADVADADVDDADGPPSSEDGGAGDSRCATPPPAACASKTTMLVWNPGPCDGERCVFEPTLESCPGGCFRQMDGGTGCNP